jgi:hypothetical protein
MSFQAKRELLARVAPCYREAGREQKSVILDEFIASTGYARKYAIRVDISDFLNVSGNNRLGLALQL